MVKESKHSLRGCLSTLICPWSLYLMVSTFIRRMLCMSMGGCIDLVGRSLCGKLKWLKNLNIYEGMLRSFNSSMVIVLDGAYVSYLI